jgi:N6-adenosine-specific RNA methylase IME4
MARKLGYSSEAKNRVADYLAEPRRSLMRWAKLDRGEHSAKPEPIRRMIEKASPGPRLELFGRSMADGWTVWGNEISRW